MPAADLLSRQTAIMVDKNEAKIHEFLFGPARDAAANVVKKGDGTA
jgi:hypothetical protein